MESAGGNGMAIARVYADAMLELAQAQGEVGVLREELREMVAHLDAQPALEDFFSSPHIDAERRRETIEKIFRGRASDLLVDSLQVLHRKGRLGLLRSVSAAYERAYDQMRGRVDVSVRSAVPLTDDLRRRIVDWARAWSGQDPNLLEEVDPSLLGGLVLQIGDAKLDASVATRLRRLAMAFQERASREIHGGKSYVSESAG